MAVVLILLVLAVLIKVDHSISCQLMYRLPTTAIRNYKFVFIFVMYPVQLLNAITIISYVVS